eukprot:5450064-Alexandrium_andersonii.AAC.1
MAIMAIALATHFATAAVLMTITAAIAIAAVMADVDVGASALPAFRSIQAATRVGVEPSSSRYIPSWRGCRGV